MFAGQIPTVHPQSNWKVGGTEKVKNYKRNEKEVLGLAPKNIIDSLNVAG